MAPLPDERRHRAFAYPYDRPAGSFCFEPATATVRPLGDDDRPAERTAVLAIGSNAAPGQLARKFPAGSLDEPILVSTARLVGHDVVYAASLTSYGAAAATIARCRDATVRVHVTWLTEAQLERLDRSEGLDASPPAYHRIALGPDDVELDPVGTTSARPAVVWAYEATAGALRLDATPWALAAVPAERRVWPAYDEAHVLARLAGVVGAADADDVVRRAVDDAETRARWRRLLAGHT